MKAKHLIARIKQCRAIAECSTCPRRQFGAVLFDPVRNIDLGSGYNGPPRGAVGTLCGSYKTWNPSSGSYDGYVLVDECLREKEKIESGTRIEIGCHHAEWNALCNANAAGIRTDGAHLVVTGEPCLICAKLIHHAGIECVYCVKGGYGGGDNGPAYLREHGVYVFYVDPDTGDTTAMMAANG